MRRLAFALVILPSVALADLHYTLTPLPQSKAISVTITDDEPSDREVYHIPAWCPGFYFLQSYEKKIFDLSATTADGAAPVIHTEPRTWQVENPKRKPVTIKYKVLSDDEGLGFFGVSVLDDKAFVNGAAGFMYKDDRMTVPVDLKVNNPTGWDLATGMDKVADGQFKAGGYDEFIDMPIQLGTMKHTTFKVGDLTFDAVWVSASNEIRPNTVRQTEVVEQVSAAAVKLFGGAPFKRYQYIFHLTNQGFLGGLEHRASTCIAMPNTANLDLSTLAAHEFFHTWNVKNIRPAVLGPFDYTRQVRTGNLWFAEGVTDYYAYVNTYRSGLNDVAWLYRVFSEQISELQNSPTRLKVPLEEACKMTWESGGFGYKDLSYYNKGLVVGLLMDGSIRSASNGTKSLDDVMRTMYDRYRLPKPGYEEDGIRKVINEVAGRDLSMIYAQSVRSIRELPYEALSGMGLRVLAPGVSYTDAGFRSVGSKVVQTSQHASGVGLRVGDLIVGRLDATTASVTLSVMRNGASMTMTLPLTNSTSSDWILEEDPLATVAARSILADWLKR